MNFLSKSLGQLRSSLQKTIEGSRLMRLGKKSHHRQRRYLSLEQLEDTQLMSVNYQGGPLLRKTEKDCILFSRRPEKSSKTVPRQAGSTTPNLLLVITTIFRIRMEQ